MSFANTLTLSTGATIPQIGLGTWQSWNDDGGKSVEIAVRNGYRHLDLALVYENQAEIGRYLKKVVPSVVKREELFITSKLWNSSHQPAQVEKELDETLKLLELEYLDLYLIHWPVAFVPNQGLYPPHSTNEGWVELDTVTTLVDTWKAVLALPKSKVRAVGVSNFTVAHLKAIIEATGVPPTVNQIEAHPYLFQPELHEFAKKNNIHITAYSPLGGNTLGKPKVTDDPKIKAIAEKKGVTEAQVLIAWAAQKGYSVIPKSTQEARIKANFAQITLSDAEFAEVSSVGRTKDDTTGEGRYERYNIPFRYQPKWDINIFDEPIEKEAGNKVNTGA